MNILGINAFHGDASAALLTDGNLISAVEEERFNRIKHWAVLYRKDRARYRDEGHGHRVQIDGPVLPFRGVKHHDDQKPLERWLNEQLRYSAHEAKHLTQTPLADLNVANRIRRKIIPVPDGWPGWLYVTQRILAELLSLRLLEAKVAGKSVADRKVEEGIESPEPQKAG